MWNEPKIAEQAAQWVGKLSQGGDAERAAFTLWLRASPQHVREFLLAMALEKEMETLDLREFDIDEILRGADENVLRLTASAAARQKTPPTLKSGARRWGWVGGLAAGIAAITGWWLLSGPGSWQRYATVVGEQRTFELGDGSMVELNPLSSMQVRLTQDARDVRLLSGDALFRVKRDPVRPFRVRANETVIRAVGTAFTVHRRQANVTVAVIEGRVEVTKDAADKHLLGAGEHVKVGAAGQVIERGASGVVHENRRTRTLTFSGDTLGEIAEDFNRYNRAPQIWIDGEALRAREFSGVFDADDPGSLVTYLGQEGGLVFENKSGGILIKEKSQ